MVFCRYLVVIWSVITTVTVVNASVNIASGKATNQSSIFKNWDSSKAVDGCFLTDIFSDCCTHTAEGQPEAWWQVDLQTQSVIDSVNIIYRDQGTLSRLAGYEICLSDTSDWTLGTRCHKDTTADLLSMSATQNVRCPGVARYLTIYNDRRVKAKTWYSDIAILELCEVQVYGCPAGRYGNGNCNNYCMNCVNNICDATSGTCENCNAGYYKIGGICSPCPVNCAGNKCGSTTGACSECDIGFYGSFCNQSCPVNCKNNVCYKDNAQCTECFIGFYGSFCDQPCPSNCKHNVCTKDNGQCTDCNDGFYGPTCTPCSSGCSTSTCDETSGHCVQCENGLYGSYCTEPCRINCKNNVCMMDDGQCTECGPGLYGPECNESCPDNCQDTSCYRSSGECKACVAGFHGSKCLKSCGNCRGVSCDKDTGDCSTECTDGWTGDKCNTKVVIVTDKDASVGIGVGLGAVILVLIVVIIIQTRRKKMKRGDTATSTHMTDISTAKESNNDQDGNYDAKSTHKEQSIAQIAHTEGNYEQLGRREVEIPHIYDTTNVDRET